MNNIKSITLLVFILAFSSFFLQSSLKNNDIFIDKSNITIESLFRVKPFFGKSARKISFSYNDRYLAFLWSSIEDNGYDLFVYDIENKKIRRITSIEKMKEFDPDEDYERFKEYARKKKIRDEINQKKNLMQHDYNEGRNVDLFVYERQKIKELKTIPGLGDMCGRRIGMS